MLRNGPHKEDLWHFAIKSANTEIKSSSDFLLDFRTLPLHLVFCVLLIYTDFLFVVLGSSQPDVYPEGFAPAHHGEPEDKVLRHVHSGPDRDRKPAAGGQTVTAASRSKGTKHTII